MPRNYEDKYEKPKDFGLLMANRLNDLKSEIKVQLPCRVQSVNHQANQVSIEILDYDFDNKGNSIPYPIIPNVPIRQPMDSGKAFIRLPVQKGDEGTIEFFDSSVDDLLIQNSATFDSSEEWHSLDNGLFTNGFLPNNKLFTYDYDSKIIIGTKTGKFVFKINESDELEVVAENVKVTSTNDVEVTCKNAKVTSSVKTEITSPETEITSNVKITGTVDIIGATSIDGILNTTGETTANGIPLTAHVHPYTWTDGAGASSTSPPSA